ncbi:D-alanyl-D-alanine carboxypeptidase [Streptomyces sp. NPDC093600]|uniref:D-alanyl-D-alanine carboxypeptidase n=1 Tax=Streptomyces sp. NPDC093600 TaxID=3366047 RepID=UPI0037FC4FC8
MTHGGGTVAGESPEEAEQQKSSQEATPGGGGRDPRLSVLRESASSASSEGSGAVQVDQPTAVFKSLAPRAPEDDTPADPAPDGEGDRLRAAVAAWVATGDQPSETAEDTEPGAGAGSAVSGDGEESAAPTGSAKASAAPETADEDPGTTGVEPAEADGEDKSWFAARKTTADETEGARADVPEAGETDADRATEDAPAAREASAAVDASTREDTPAPASAATDAPTREDTPAPASAATDAPTREDTPAPVTPAAAAPARDEEPAADQSASADAPANDAPATGAPATGDAADAPASADEAAEAPAVDQPTAVFKAVRPPVVDQPTTALKIPPTPPAKAAEPAAESDAERTSQFIPLRRDLPESPAAKAKPQPLPKAQPQPQPRPEPSATPAPAPGAPTGPATPASLTEAERTKQQPMPPLPPLDLLAELTNTPPPPPTPLRTAARRVRIWTPLVVLLLIVFAVVQFVRPLPTPALTLSAAPTFTFEGGELTMPWPTEGQGAAEVEGVGSLGTYGVQKPAPIASVAKTMTAYVILRDHPIKGNQTGPEITVDRKAGEQAKAKDESTAQIKEGQQYTEKELLQLLMIPSGNNVARLLARWDAGTEAAFVEKMNAAAKDLGMTDSVYTDPSGLQSTTVSTPLDQLKLAKAVMQYDVFREIVDMPNLTVDGIPGRIENNNNILLQPGVRGIKTGSSTPAGGNLLWAAYTVVDGKERRILGVVMGAKDAAFLNDKLQLAIDYSLKLIQEAQKDVTSASVVRKGQVVGYVDDGLGGQTPVVATQELKAIGWPGLKVGLALTDGGKAVPHAGKAGDVVGQVSIGTGAGKVSAPVALQKDLVEPGFDKKLTRLG